MKKTPLFVTGAAAALVLGGGSSAFALSHEVDMKVYGHHTTVRMMSGTVGDALKGQGVTIKPTDKVTPAVSTPLDDASVITVEKQRPVAITVDGRTTKKLTTATTVGDALKGFELPADARISPAPTTKLTDKTTAITVETTDSVTFVGQYGQAAFEVSEPTVGEAAQAHLMDVQPAVDKFFDVNNQQIDPATPVSDGMTVRVQRIRATDTTSPQEIGFSTVTKDDPTLDAGETKVITPGQKGSKDVTTHTVTVDGQVTEQTVTAENVTKAPVDEVVAKGTKAKAASAPAASAPAKKASSGTSSAPAKESASAAAPAASSSSSTKSASGSSDQGGSASGPTTTCTASFYGRGDGTDGGPTASGERFNSEAMTAASKTLPLGSHIRVTNKATGQSVVVKINDRGPYVSGRCLDLSAGAFDAIGDTGSGTMTVTYQRVD